ncbi:Aldo/keto reductase [Dacryopinax primogenitus]|uniref:Aldo/keto reductase n=1 Tax=Dacryopinax primogenitus (strain DJM 731) TaxID=1858805 RepID=M5G4N8_DACPD|nr:Aldo/keto reductase [Dacryopinax primogenitus]EJU00827.1 Aldo/keto reductase [Dacryopinax primogenitus]
MPSRVPLLYVTNRTQGSAAFGEPAKHVTRLHTLPECQAVIDCFTQHGYGLYDCARGYGFGTSEEYVGKLDLKGGRVDTKGFAREPGGLAPEKLRAMFNESLQALGQQKIRVYYLHAPDRKAPVPYEDTLRELNKMYEEGLIEEIGLSNFHSWEVAEFVWIARKNGWKQPTVYQGVYNVVERMIEPELIPCCRKYGLRFYAYSPLASGLLGGQLLTLADIETTDSPRWDPKIAGLLAGRLRQRYTALFPLLKPLKDALERNGMELPEAALRWLQHHSALGEQDGVVIGASSVGQLETNIKYCEAGPLPEDVVALLDEVWKRAKSTVWHYATQSSQGYVPQKA